MKTKKIQTDEELSWILANLEKMDSCYDHHLANINLKRTESYTLNKDEIRLLTSYISDMRRSIDILRRSIDILRNREIIPTKILYLILPMILLLIYCCFLK